MNKIFAMLLLGVFLISFTSAALDIKTFDKDKSNYGEIKINDWLLFNKADYRLTDYGASVIDVWAEGEYTLYKKTHLFTGVFYKDTLGREGDLKDVKFYIWEEDINTIYNPIYENQNCYTNANQSLVCDKVLISNNSYQSDNSNWILYEKGMDLEEGDGRWRLEAKRNKNQEIDFILEAHGKEFEEWAWWNDSWEKKRDINIQENSGDSLTNYSVAINISYDSEMQTDFDDLRFLNSAEDTELGYWIESKLDSNWAYVWIKIPSLTASVNTTISMYYNNSAVSSNSNGQDTFSFFDDFNDASLNGTKWTTIVGNVVEAGGVLTITGNDFNSMRGVKANTNFTYGTEFKTLVRENGCSTTSNACYAGLFGNLEFTSRDTAKRAGWFIYKSGSASVNTRESSTTSTQTDLAIGDPIYHIKRIEFMNSSFVRFLDNSDTLATHTTNIPTTEIEPTFGVQATGDDIQVDWIFARDKVSLEPISFVGNEVGDCFYEYNSENISIADCNESTTIISPEGTLDFTSENTKIDFIYNTGGINYSDSFFPIQDATTINLYFRSTGAIIDTTSWNYKIFENSRTLNDSSYETKSEIFKIGITANSSLSSVTLLYNGTEYTTTKSGEEYSNTIDIKTGVENNSVRWRFNYAGDSFYSSYSYQDVALVNLSLCDGSLTNDFLNMSFKDEDDLSTINASISSSTFNYYLGAGSTYKTYTYQNSADEFTYRLCATPTTEIINIKPYVQFKQDPDYPQRIWDAMAQAYTSTVTNQILYLLNTLNGLYVTFQVINAAEQGIDGVEVVAIREISGEDVVVANGLTDTAGGITFWLNPDFVHTFNFSKDGYESLIYTTAPTQTAYTVTMGAGAVSEEDCTRGMSYVISPSIDYLDANTNYDFSYYLSSSYWNVDNFSAYLYYGNDTLIDSSTLTTQGGTMTFSNINVTNQSTLYMDYSFSTNGSLCLDSKRVWYTQETYGRQFSLFRLFSDINSAIDNNVMGIEGESGNDTFGRALIAFLILFAVAATTINKYGIQNETAIMGMIFGVVLVLDVGFGLVPPLAIGNITAVDYFFSVVAFIIFIAFLIREER